MSRGIKGFSFFLIFFSTRCATSVSQQRKGDSTGRESYVYSYYRMMKRGVYLTNKYIILTSE